MSGSWQIGALGPNAKAALKNTSEEIMAQGDEWSPTAENLEAVIDSIMQIQHEDWRDAQQRGIALSREKGQYGRPKKKPPTGFEMLYRAWKSGTLSLAKCAEASNVSPYTFRRWVKEFEEGSPEASETTR